MNYQKISKIYQNRDEYNILENFENINENNNLVMFLKEENNIEVSNSDKSVNSDDSIDIDDI